MPDTNTRISTLKYRNRFFSESTVLVVDDNVQNLELLQAFLDELPVQVVTACNGVDALEKVDEHRPDLILLDVMMPRMSGFQVCQRLKSDVATKHIPILMITVLNEPSEMERAHDAGVDELVSKPVSRLDIVTRVKRLLRFED